jgi:transcriptional regulator
VYEPPSFAVTDLATLHDLIDDLAAAHLVMHDLAQGTICSSFLPLLLDRADTELGVLRGHLARANPDWRHAGPQALALFAGPHGYISPSWYPSKAEHGKVVPTWNYVVVQAHGTLIVHDDTTWVRNLVTRLTDHHEASRVDPWAVTDAPTEWVEQMLRGIVGVELRITQLHGKVKMSQNRSAADRAGALAGLAAGANTTAAAQSLAVTALSSGPRGHRQEGTTESAAPGTARRRESGDPDPATQT